MKLTEVEFQIVKGHCPQCGPSINSSVVGHHQAKWEDENCWAITEHRILKCRGCDTIYHQTVDTFSENYDIHTDPHTGEHIWEYDENFAYWPSPSARPKPDWLGALMLRDPDLHRLFSDIYKGLDNDLAVFAAIGIRTVFDRASELLDIDPELSFKKKLDALMAMGKIGTSEYDTLDVLTDAGGAAAHRGWKPSPQELNTMMGIIEAFLYRTFILDAAVKALKSSVPARKAKTQA